MNSYLDYLKAALLHPVNFMVFGVAVLFGLVTFNPVMFAIAALWEVAWAGGAPVVPAFRKSVDKKKKDDTRSLKEKQDAAAVGSLSPAMQERYTRIARIASSIRSNYSKDTAASKVFLDQITARVDELLDRYIHLLTSYETYRKQIQSNAPAELQTRMLALDTEIAGADEQVAKVKIRQKEILEKRLEKAHKAEKDYSLLGAQLDTIEELIQLLQSQAVSMSKPEELTGQLDSIMSEVEVTEATVAALDMSAEEAFDRELEEAERRKQIT